ncbi:MobF family relaxase [Corynebacterium pseudogenitalium]|uniref:MobF family relaxase n=1 Tax=Corynebacterium pseudogenitalium TaxID=38303 RepID=UPI003B9F2164
MLSVRAVNAGNGYEYLLSSVATNDAPTEHTKLADYYAAKGTPPGRWLGKGLQGFNTGSIYTGAEVQELHMAALYGEGLHPDSDEILRQGKGLNACKIGRAFPWFTAKDPLLEALYEAESAYRRANNTLPTAEERREMALAIAGPFFKEAHGVEAENGRELLAWVNQKRANVRQAVAGFDFTFSPAKSISTLWALSDEATANKIAELHHKAVADCIAWAEDEFIRTRAGAGGKIQERTQGIIAAEFTHFDTRMGDPDLHSHVLISNKVQNEQGRWKSLDSRMMFRFHQPMSYRYDMVLADLLRREMGIEMIATDRGQDKDLLWEVAGVSQDLIDQFSKRREYARPVYERLVEEYTTKHQAQPSTRIVNRLWQQAILETRDAKKPAQSLAELRQQWRDEVRAMNNGEDLLLSLENSVQSAAQRTLPLIHEDHYSTIIDAALENVLRRRSTFRRSHLLTSVASQLMAFRFESSQQRDEVQHLLVQRILDEHAVSLAASEPHALPDALTDADGNAIDRMHDSAQFTTPEVLEAEQAVLDAVIEPVAVFVEEAAIQKALHEHEQREGWSLNDGQQSLARHLLSCGTLAATGVGPAGTGKTASMKLVANTWRAQGRNVIGLAPSAAAADVLSEDIEAQATTIDSLTFTWSGRHPTKPGKSLEALPIDINSGDMLLVDEAGMASTKNIAALIEIAREAGAIVRFVGDPLQLDAVESGGLFGAMTRTGTTATLTDVMRFKDDHEQSNASLQIREGNAEGLDLHFDRGWVSGGTRNAMLEDAAANYLEDLAAGRKALLLASTNTDVVHLNTLIQNVRKTRGEVSEDVQATIARGEQCGVGDVILTRKNQRFFEKRDGTNGAVNNGDLYIVDQIHNDGSLTVREENSSTRKLLPASYVAQHVQLGYASTVHRAQGATVDVAHAVIDKSVDRAGLYVALTRGKYATKTYCVTDVSLDETAEQAHQHHAGNQSAPTAREVLETVLRNDRRQRSAMEVLWDDVAEATSNERLTALWEHGRSIAVDEFIASHFEAALDALPHADYVQLVTVGDGDLPVREAWRDLLQNGIDPRPLTLEELRHCDGYKDLGRLLSYKLRNHLPDQPTFDGLPPQTETSDAALLTWLHSNVNIESSPAANAAPSFTPGDKIIGQSFAGVDFSAHIIRDVDFEDCDFSGAIFTEARLKDVHMLRCRLDNATIDNATLIGTQFSLCHMDNADFSGTTFGAPNDYHSKVEFLNVRGESVSFARTIMHVLEATWSHLRNLDLRGAALNFATFIGVDLSQARSDLSTTAGFRSDCIDCAIDTDLPMNQSQSSISASAGVPAHLQSSLPHVVEQASDMEL